MTPNPFNPGYYGSDELAAFGFRSVGSHVQVAKNATLIGIENISIGSHVRIDGYTTVVADGQGFLTLGSYIHIGAGCYLAAGGGVVMEDFSGLSQGVRIYSRTDDYSGRTLTNPTVPAEFLGVTQGTVRLGRHVILGSGTVVLPGIVIGDGSSVGALSLVTKSLDPWGVYFGSPARRLKARAQGLLALEAELRAR